jgi:hypothetical protein
MDPDLGVVEGVAAPNPALPGPDFGIVDEQGFQPAFDPTPSTLGPATGNDATFFIF